MRVSLEWLKELSPVDRDASAIAATLTGLGFEVEGIEELGQGLDHVVVAEVLGQKAHPGADRLTLVDVVAEGARRTVVCGAPNVPAAGGRVAWALPGAHLSTGLDVALRQVRGFESFGMLCSEAELGLGEDKNGLMLLDERLVAGQALSSALALRDTVLDVAVTPNRPDALGMIGIAREIAAALHLPLQIPSADIEPLEENPPASTCARVELDDSQGCSRYVARVLTSVPLGNTPWWMRRRLQAAGVRPISLIVDITNYVMLETGQPLHAFDLDRLADARIVVRRAKSGERMQTLDGVMRDLVPEDLLICDAEKVVALAGVMGGASSQVTALTQRVLLEAACFEPRVIRRTSKRLGLSSESSTRFERGCDPNGLDYASRRAASLANARLARGAVDVSSQKALPKVVRLRPERCRSLLGLALPDAEISARLMRLGLSVAQTAADLAVTVPTFRRDLQREADLIEEVARLGGLDAIPASLPPLREGPRPAPASFTLAETVRDALTEQGLCEARSLAFVSSADLEVLDLEPDDPRCQAVSLRNPLGNDQALLRTTLLPGLLQALRRNLVVGSRTVRLFEVGTIFLKQDGEIREQLHVAGLLSGIRDGWLAANELLDFFDLKGVLEVLAERLGRKFESEPWPSRPLHPKESARIRCGSVEVGTAGALDPTLRKRLELDQACYLFELSLEALVPAPVAQFAALPRFPAVTRDLSIFTEPDAIWGDLTRAVVSCAVPNLENVTLVDEYRPADGRRGWLIRFTYRASDRTLTDEEVNQIHEQQAVPPVLSRFAQSRR